MSVTGGNVLQWDTTICSTQRRISRDSFAIYFAEVRQCSLQDFGKLHQHSQSLTLELLFFWQTRSYKKAKNYHKDS